MTLLSRRKRRTTARPTPPRRTAYSLAALAVLAGAPVLAQQPGRQAAQFGTPFPTRQFTGTAPAQTGQPGVPQTGYNLPPTGAPNTGLPPGYRLAGGTRPAPPPVAERTGPAGSAGGKVMYFRKEADKLAPDLPPETGAVAMAAAADRPPGVPGIPDVPVPPPGGFAPPTPPLTVTDRPIPGPGPEPVVTPPAPPPVVTPVEVPTVQSQPKPKDEPKAKPKDDLTKPPPPEELSLPPRRAIFMMYDDARLQSAILESVGERLKRPPSELTPFPQLKPVVAPGTPFVPKTAALPPGRLFVEPAFVVHRRLHFEEKNSERYGWDLGFFQPFASLMYFYKDVLLLPNSVASGLEVGFYDTSAGKCLPGSPTPYYLYPPGLTITGMAATAGVYTGGAFILHPVGAGNLPGPFLH